MVVAREDTPLEDRWNVEALYPSLEAWRDEFNRFVPVGSPRWPQMQALHGTLSTGANQLHHALDFVHNLERKLTKLFTYAHLRHDEDVANNDFKIAYNESLGALNDFKEETSWFEPELLSLSHELIEQYLQHPLLKEYRFNLEKTFRLKPYTLTADKELLLAMSGKALATSHKAFSAINDADFKFGTATDEAGQKHELTHGKYALYLRSPDRTLRESAFKNYHNTFKSFENTLAELLSGQVETHVFHSRARGFSSSLEAALFPRNIDSDVYHSLIRAVREQIAPLHRYMKIRSKVLKLSELHPYDLQVPLIPHFDMKVPYHEAEQLVIASVAPLGDEYQSALKKGLEIERWVDRYENKNKRSGAYSSGCYDSSPYILMNYKEIMRDLFTLAHEAGHSMHSYMSRKYQPYVYSGYSIFVAEVASTFNEELLMHTMLQKAQTLDEKIFLVTQKIEDIRSTLFRQTQFAEFELLIHRLAEENTPITPQLLHQEYLKLNTFYYGEAVHQDPEISVEWSRIPHFYYNFYVFQYATGISAALALADQVLHGGKAEREAYLNFLKSGESVYPIEALKIAGIDMQSDTPIKQAIHRFSSLLDLLEKYLEEQHLSSSTGRVLNKLAQNNPIQ